MVLILMNVLEAEEFNVTLCSDICRLHGHNRIRFHFVIFHHRQESSAIVTASYFTTCPPHMPVLRSVSCTGPVCCLTLQRGCVVIEPHKAMHQYSHPRTNPTGV